MGCSCSSSNVKEVRRTPSDIQQKYGNHTSSKINANRISITNTAPTYKKNPAYDIIEHSISGEAKRIEKLVQRYSFLTQIADVRGHTQNVIDLLEEQEFNTEMWTIFHFACYHGHTEIVKYFIEKVGIVNPLLSLMKNPAMNEIEETFTCSYEDDKIYGLILAFHNRHLEIFEYLLNVLSKCWSKMTVPYFVQYYRSPNDNKPNFELLENVYEGVWSIPSKKFTSEIWREAIGVLLKSKTAHTYYLNLSYNDKRIFIYETMRDISEQPQNLKSHPDEKSVKELFMEEFSEPPYAGVFQYYLAFEDKTSNHEILRKAIKNSNPKFDSCEYLIYEDLVEVELDINYEAEATEGIYGKPLSLVKGIFDTLREYQDKALDIIEDTKLNLLNASKDGDLEKLKQMIKSEDNRWYLNGIEKFKGLQASDAYIRKEWGIAEEIMDGRREDEPIDTDDWNPLNFAIFYNNFECARYLIEETDMYVKRAIKYKDPAYSDEKKAIFSLIVSFENNNMDMFKFIYDSCSYIWLDDMRIIYFLQTLFKSSKSAEECTPWVECILRSQTTHALIKSMSFSYRFLFVESLMKIHDMVRQEGKLSIYTTICECLSEAPYSLYFFSVFIEKFCPKILKEERESNFKRESSQIDNFIPLLSDAYTSLTNEDIELFIKYCCVTSELVNNAGTNAPFQNKWWQKERKSHNESKRTSTPELNDNFCKNYPNCDQEECKECKETNPRFSNKDLEAIIDRFEKRLESDKNYKYYVEDPALGQNNSGERSSIFTT